MAGQVYYLSKSGMLLVSCILIPHYKTYSWQRCYRFPKSIDMNKFFRGIIAAWGAKKLGGGCLSTIIIFILIYTLLGKCNNGARAAKIIQKPPVAAVYK